MSVGQEVFGQNVLGQFFGLKRALGQLRGDITERLAKREKKIHCLIVALDQYQGPML